MDFLERIGDDLAKCFEIFQINLEDVYFRKAPFSRYYDFGFAPLPEEQFQELNREMTRIIEKYGSRFEMLICNHIFPNSEKFSEWYNVKLREKFEFDQWRRGKFYVIHVLTLPNECPREYITCYTKEDVTLKFKELFEGKFEETENICDWKYCKYWISEKRPCSKFIWISRSSLDEYDDEFLNSF